eukprot:2513673-Pyramimonas_sp.AAC.1
MIQTRARTRCQPLSLPVPVLLRGESSEGGRDGTVSLSGAPFKTQINEANVFGLPRAERRTTSHANADRQDK